MLGNAVHLPTAEEAQGQQGVGPNGVVVLQLLMEGRTRSWLVSGDGGGPWDFVGGRPTVVGRLAAGACRWPGRGATCRFQRINGSLIAPEKGS